MSNAPAINARDVLWPRIKQEITGIQLLLETVEQMYFKSPRQRGMEQLAADTPLLYGLMQTDVCELRQQWDASGLKIIRDKYLSHNDLAWAGTEPHSLNIPLSAADVLAMKSLADGLRAFRREANLKIGGAAYVDGLLDLNIQREIDLLSRSLLAGEAFYELLPEHACLQDALTHIEYSNPKGA